MKRKKAILSLASLIFLFLMFCTTMPAQQPPDNVGGNWTIYSTSVQNGETVVKHVQIEQYGNSLTGHFEGPDQSGPIQGQINGHHIRFSTVTRNVLNFWGQVSGNEMSGTYGLHGKHAPWQAVRPAAASVADPPTGTVYASQPVLVPPAPVPQPTPQPAIDSAPSGASAPTPAPLSQAQLEGLVAPIALYPDALVAQVLAASANPDQVAYADGWLAQNKNLTGAALAQAVDQQSWDPSVKALTQFPSVLDNLAHNLSWTSSLGQAFVNQQADVMAAVQTMRAKAQAAGTLQSASQITVTQPSPNTIVIQPANPQVVYVPQYNPAVVYGTPIAVPLYVPPPVPVASVGLYFGSGVAVGAVVAGGGWGEGWGWHAWNVNWGGWGGGGSTIIYNNNTYINNHIWNNRPYNGYRPWAGGATGTGNNAYYAANGTYHPEANYHPGTDTHYGPNGQYRANGYYGPDGGWHPDVNHAGGATGTENPGYYDKNGSYHPDPGYRPGTDTHYGPDGAYHPNGYYGPDGGWHNDAPGTKPADQPNGGPNGNHGLIGGNGATQHQPSTLGTQDRLGGSQEARTNSNGSKQLHSPMSGYGRSARAESNRGHASMHPSGTQRAAMRRPAMHSQPAHNGGGERRR